MFESILHHLNLLHFSNWHRYTSIWTLIIYKANNLKLTDKRICEAAPYWMICSKHNCKAASYWMICSKRNCEAASYWMICSIHNCKAASYWVICSKHNCKAASYWLICSKHNCKSSFFDNWLKVLREYVKVWNKQLLHLEQINLACS